jgi:hypothetical protein
MHFVTITSARRAPGKVIDTRQNLQSIQPTFPETGILFYSTGALSYGFLEKYAAHNSRGAQPRKSNQLILVEAFS